MDVAGEPVAFLEDRLAALLEAIQLDEPAVMQGERGLPGDRFDQATRHQWSSLSEASDATTVIQPSVRVAEHERAPQRDVPVAHLAAEVADGSGSRGSSPRYSMVCVQPGRRRRDARP